MYWMLFGTQGVMKEARDGDGDGDGFISYYDLGVVLKTQ
ncbi:hypothetical protein BofuT4_P097340.1 [Botrytis cinerea T4]|uniref:EF-hand domain-containing protein n=1 Tax=Botryotinia fuckeliana (strain T4) TaxID=999810 RepID=G2YCX8_BOTF4|nr:hypothetical protein BofuT4_P097340.1 [Botrytis cinerea T4]